jgi:drug/metabolite transporter (DMT)-like permease
VTPPPSALTRPVVLSLLTLYVVWGSTYFALRWVVESLPPLLAAGVRYVLAGAVLLAIGRLRGSPWPAARQWLAALPVGALLFLCGNGFVSLAETRMSSALAAVVAATMPLFAALIAPLFGERSRAGEWGGMALGFCGVLILSRNGELRAELGLTALLMCSPIAWAFGSMLARKLPVASGFNAPATQMVAGGATLLLAGVLRGEQPPDTIPLRAGLAFLWLVFGGSVLAFSAYAYLLKATRPALAMSYSYVNPPIAVAIGALLGHEPVGLEVLGAVALIGAGTFALLRAART